MRSVTFPCIFVSALVLGSGLAISAQEAAKHPITFEDMIKLHRIAEPQVSRDGKWVAYTVSTPDMEANRGVSNIWIAPTSGGAAMQLTQSGHDSSRCGRLTGRRWRSSLRATAIRMCICSRWREAKHTH